MSKIIGHGHPDNNLESHCFIVRLLSEFRLKDLQDLLSSLTKQANLHLEGARFKSQPEHPLSELKCFVVFLSISKQIPR
jgi:hypothetical protein